MKWIEIKKPILLLSPMAGYTDSAFRIICKEQGANLLMTELISADAIAHFASKKQDTKSKTQTNSNTEFRNSKQISNSNIQKFQKNPTFKLMEFQKVEMPIIVQLFGKDPEKFALASAWIEENLHPAGIDINMGCPAKKVVGSDHGVTLLRDQNRGVEVVKAVREATSLPLSVKTRLGWENDDEILEFGLKLIEAGVDALIIHGRIYKDGFSGKSRWENIYLLKSKIQSSNVKIIGNGDIKSFRGIKEKVGNLDGVAIGRGTIGNPFIFNSKFDRLSENRKLELKKKTILEHAKLAFEIKGERGVIELRKHLLAYFKGHSQAKKLRKEFVDTSNVLDIKKVLKKI